MSEAGSDAGRSRGRVVVAVIVLAFALVYLDQSRRLSMGTAEHPGPGLFPMAVGTLLAAVCIATIVEGLRAGGDGPVELPRGPGLVRAVALGSALVVYVLLVSWLGYLVASVLVSVPLVRVLSGKSWMRASLSGLAVSLMIYVLFGIVLGVSLPTGSLGI